MGRRADDERMMFFAAVEEAAIDGGNGARDKSVRRGA